MNHLEVIIILSMLLGIGTGVLLGLKLVRKRDRELMQEIYSCLERGYSIPSKSVYHYSLKALFINKTKRK